MKPSKDAGKNDKPAGSAPGSGAHALAGASVGETNAKGKSGFDTFKMADAKFIAAGHSLKELPSSTHPEFGFAGKSNVGKSSLLNSLMMRRNLVRTSKTPGATRTINLFEAVLAARVEGEVSEPPRMFSFADLPGYGYAQRAKSERASWGPMLESYLKNRPELCGLVVLVDIRRGASEEDAALVEFVTTLERPLPVIVCATKIDKLSRAKRAPEVARLGRELAGKGAMAIGYSVVTHEGRGALWRRLISLAAFASEAA